jgi:aminopeptidase
MNDRYETRLDQYADVIISVGLNLQPGQRLHIGAGAYSGFLEGPPPEAAPFVRLLAEKAYRAGARYVDVSYEDEQLRLIRFQHAPTDSFEEVSPWGTEQAATYMERGDAILGFLCSDPNLLRDQDQGALETAQGQVFPTVGPLLRFIGSNASNWSGVALPTPGWAAAVLPDVDPDRRMERMWDVIFDMCRITGDDPVAGWRDHVADMTGRARHLNERRYQALHYKGPGTDLTAGLPDGHLWICGGLETQNGITIVPNIPTEEIFTLPNKERIDGTVRSTKPLGFGGSTIEGLSLTFANGRVVKAEAETGQGLLDSILDTDDGARSLGEISLVPHSSPISQSGLVFQNILYDENASCHMALGNAYRFSLEGGTEMSDEGFAAAGGNQSQVHVDFMMGSAEIDVNGIHADGTSEPVMRSGEWAF